MEQQKQTQEQEAFNLVENVCRVALQRGIIADFEAAKNVYDALVTLKTAVSLKSLPFTENLKPTEENANS